MELADSIFSKQTSMYENRQGVGCLVPRLAAKSSLINAESHNAYNKISLDKLGPEIKHDVMVVINFVGPGTESDRVVAIPDT